MNGLEIDSKRTGLYLVVIIAIAALLKYWLVIIDALPFNADEAVVALMARHILHGERPLFFYGQAYMGSFDAWLVAAGFLLFGEHVWVIRFIQGVLFTGVLLTTYFLGEQASGSKTVGVLTSACLSIPAVTMTLYTTVSLGGYGEALLIGNLILLLGVSLFQSDPSGGRRFDWKWFGLGFLAGFGLWVFGLTLVYSIPVGVGLFIKQMDQHRKGVLLPRQGLLSWGWAGLGALLGASFWWIYALRNGIDALLLELSGSAIRSAESGKFLLLVLQHVMSFIVFGGTAVFGMRPPWEIRWLALPLLPFLLALWLGVSVFIVKRFVGRRETAADRLLAGVILTLYLGFVFTPFGADPSGRYFLPMMIPLAIFVAEFFYEMSARYGKYILLGVGFIGFYNLVATVQCASQVLPGITTQFDSVTQIDHRQMDALIGFLRDKGETRGFTNYWIAYPLAFQSHEELIFIPRLPYHQDFRYTSRDDRYAPYDLTVERAARVAYITAKHPALDRFLRDRFDKKGLSWKEEQIGDYHVFYHLSRKINPQEIGLGKTTDP